LLKITFNAQLLSAQESDSQKTQINRKKMQAFELLINIVLQSISSYSDFWWE